MSKPDKPRLFLPVYRVATGSRPCLNYRTRMMIKTLAIALLLVATHARAQETFTGTVTHVTDGDSLWVRPDAGGAPRKLRIDGIDAPEICQSAGVAARATLSQYALRQRVKVTVRRFDDYGRGLARIERSDQDLGAQMVRAGYAWSYRWRRDPGPYAAEEALARRARQGLFAAAEVPESPRDFRKRHGPCPIPGDDRQGASPQTGQVGWRAIRTSVNSMARPSSMSSRPVNVRPAPVSSLSASAACIDPIMPTSGAKTPRVAQRVSSKLVSGANTQA